MCYDRVILMGGLSSPYPYPSVYQTPTNTRTLEDVSSYQVGH